MAVDAQDVAERAARQMYATDNAARTFGIHVVEIGPGRSCLRMTVRQTMVNGHNIGHGGMTFTLADTALAYASNSYNQKAVATIAQISFLAPTFAGDVLTATATERAVAGRLGIYDIDVRNQTGKQVATFHGHTQTIKGKLIEDLPVTRDM